MVGALRRIGRGFSERADRGEAMGSYRNDARWAFPCGCSWEVDRAEAIQNKLAHIGQGYSISNAVQSPKSLTPVQRQMDINVILSFIRGSGINSALTTIIIL